MTRCAFRSALSIVFPPHDRHTRTRSCGRHGFPEQVFGTTNASGTNGGGRRVGLGTTTTSVVGRTEVNSVQEGMEGNQITGGTDLMTDDTDRPRFQNGSDHTGSGGKKRKRLIEIFFFRTVANMISLRVIYS